jgi:hypothetical protein
MSQLKLNARQKPASCAFAEHSVEKSKDRKSARTGQIL